MNPIALDRKLLLATTKAAKPEAAKLPNPYDQLQQDLSLLKSLLRQRERQQKISEKKSAFYHYKIEQLETFIKQKRTKK